MAAAGQVVEDQSYVTLATNDTYALGALVLGNSLRRVNTTRRLTVMITSGVTQAIRQQLSSVFDVVKEVSVLDSRDTVNLALLTRPDLGVTFTKLHCWRLTQFSKCVFLDADTLVMQNVDELFEREELSASPDAGWPDCFNSGVFVYTPSEETYSALLQFAVSQGSFDGGDQGLLNMYFSDWSTKDIARHLPFIYNVVSQAFYSYLPAFRHFEKDVKIAHFIGAVKPWHHQYNTSTGTVETSGDAGHHAQFLALWWKIFMTSVHAQLDSSMTECIDMVGLEGDMAHLNLVGSGRDAHAQASSSQRLDSPSRQYSWEKGQIDYMGVDAFANIQLKLEESINGSRKTDPEREPQSAAMPVATPVPVTTTTTTAAGNNQKPLKSALKKS